MIAADWMEQRPRRLLGHEVDAEGQVTVLRPKVLSPRWRWLLRLLRRPVYRVRLDARGAFVWDLCDGSRSAAAIAAATQAAFADDPGDSAERTARFLHTLAQGGFIALDPPESSREP